MSATNDAFLAPPTTVLGLTLRPLTAGTEAQLDRLNTLYRAKLKTMFAETDDSARAAHSAFQYLACFLFIHSQPKERMLTLCWDFEKFDAALNVWLDQFSRDQIFSAAPAITAIREAVKAATNYTVENQGADDPNSSSRGGSSATSAQSPS